MYLCLPRYIYPESTHAVKILKVMGERLLRVIVIAWSRLDGAPICETKVRSLDIRYPPCIMHILLFIHTLTD